MDICLQQTGVSAILYTCGKNPNCWAFEEGYEPNNGLTPKIYSGVVVIEKKVLLLSLRIMVECNTVTAFAAIGAVFISYKLLTLVKSLFDIFIASGVPVSSGINTLSLHNI